MFEGGTSDEKDESPEVVESRCLVGWIEHAASKPGVLFCPTQAFIAGDP